MGWSKAQGNNKVWLQKALKKCHGSEVGLHNKWVKCSHKSKMSLELCRRAGKVALTMEKNRCARADSRSSGQACWQGGPGHVQAYQQAPRNSCCSRCSRRKGCPEHVYFKEDYVQGASREVLSG